MKTESKNSRKPSDLFIGRSPGSKIWYAQFWDRWRREMYQYGNGLTVMLPYEKEDAHASSPEV
jgi:hypothetical protein